MSDVNDLERRLAALTSLVLPLVRGRHVRVVRDGENFDGDIVGELNGSFLVRRGIDSPIEVLPEEIRVRN